MMHRIMIVVCLVLWGTSSSASEISYQFEPSPRILKLQFADSEMLKTMRVSKQSFCNNKKRLTHIVTCFSLTRNQELLSSIFRNLSEFSLQPPKASGQYGNGWLLAVLYDQVSAYSNQFELENHQIVDRLKEHLEQLVAILERGNASLWHGRVSLANHAMIILVSLGDKVDSSAIVQKVHKHYWIALEALEYTEAWPEGFSYWINNRALGFGLSAKAYIDGVNNAPFKSRIRDVFERVGLWHIYGTRPDGRFEGFGDEGPRVDLKDVTRPAIDLFTQITNSRILATYSEYLYQLHGASSYYSGYRWMYPFFKSQYIKPLKPVTKASLSVFEGVLPKYEIFGIRSMGMFYARQSWSDNAAYFFFRAGNAFSHHGHYDAGHFTLFKEQPIISNRTVYKGVLKEKRLYYDITTASKNSILIQDPGEKFKPNRYFKKNVNTGGQRLSMATGSAIKSVSHWKSLPRFRASELRLFNETEDSVTLQYDITRAYNSIFYTNKNNRAKVKRVARTVLWSPNSVKISDAIDKTSSDFITTSQIHFLGKEKLNINPRSSNGVILQVGARGQFEIHIPDSMVWSTTNKRHQSSRATEREQTLYEYLSAEITLLKIRPRAFSATDQISFEIVY